MNMQVANLASTAAIPIAALSCAAPEPVVALINAYQAGVAAYNGLPDHEEGEAFAAQTYGPPLTQLKEAPPAILTATGAVAAVRFMRDEIRDFNDPEDLLPLLDRLLEFLTSAAGSTLVHPDAELLALDAQLEPLEREDEAIHAKLDETQAEWQRVHDDRTGLEFTRADQMYFGSSIKDQGRNTIAPWAICYIRPLDLAAAHTTARQRVIGHNERLEELKKAYSQWYEALEEFGRASGRSKLADRAEEIYRLADPLADKILATPAKTLAGLAVKAKLLRRKHRKPWETDPSELLFEEECIISLVEDVLAASGRGQ